MLCTSLIQSLPSVLPVALPALTITPNLETWHHCLGHANSSLTAIGKLTGKQHSKSFGIWRALAKRLWSLAEIWPYLLWSAIVTQITPTTLEVRDNVLCLDTASRWAVASYHGHWESRTPWLTTCAAEYMAISEAEWELVWLWTLLQELGYTPSHPTPPLCDNSAAVLLSADQAFHKGTKHLDVRYHWIWECVEHKEIIVGQIESAKNIADVLTKALPGPRFVEMYRLAVDTWEFKTRWNHHHTDVHNEGECER